VLLSFPPFPLIRFSNISLSYHISSKFTNALIIELDEVRDGLQVEDFKRMLDTCHSFWAHPLLVPVLFLDMLMSKLEVEILVNIDSILEIETIISKLPSLDMDARPLAERENVTSLLTRLHNTLKIAIKLLDAANWMEKAAVMLDQIGHDLNQVEEVSKNSPWIIMQWTEIRDFLDDLRKITNHLQPDPAMTQQRCLSQIDIVSSHGF
jgi:hypothetical protein